MLGKSCPVGFLLLLLYFVPSKLCVPFQFGIYGRMWN